MIKKIHKYKFQTEGGSMLLFLNKDIDMSNEEHLNQTDIHVLKVIEEEFGISEMIKSWHYERDGQTEKDSIIRIHKSTVI